MNWMSRTATEKRALISNGIPLKKKSMYLESRKIIFIFDHFKCTLFSFFYSFSYSN